MELTRRRFFQALAAVNAVALTAGLPIIVSAGLDAPLWHYRLEIPWDIATHRIISRPERGGAPFDDVTRQWPANIVFSQDGAEMFLY